MPDHHFAIVTALSALISKSREEGKVWQTRAYRKVLNGLEAIPCVHSFRDVEGLPGIGKQIKIKILRIIETGDAEFWAAYELFLDMEGVNPNRAHEWASAGFRTITELPLPLPLPLHSE